MDMDIVERLRNNADERLAVWQIVTIMNEAADEIERLREALKDIENMPIVYESENIYKQIARSALQQKDTE